MDIALELLVLRSVYHTYLCSMSYDFDSQTFDIRTRVYGNNESRCIEYHTMNHIESNGSCVLLSPSSVENNYFWTGEPASLFMFN